jgi:CheY-like chemotaxis protein
VRIPAVAAGAYGDLQATGSFRQISDPLTSLEGAVILVVDDEPDGRTLLARLLGEAGAQVICAANGETGLQMLGRHGISVLVSDISMPGMDGFEFIRRVRSSEQEFSHVPAIALTAYARTEDRDRSLAAGFQRHIAKPYSLPDLTAAIAALWRDSPATAAS